MTSKKNLIAQFIRIGIADKNDNPPYFDKTLYEAEVDENEDIQHTVLTVTAKDKDECESIILCLKLRVSPVITQPLRMYVNLQSFHSFSHPVRDYERELRRRVRRQEHDRRHLRRRPPRLRDEEEGK